VPTPGVTADHAGRHVRHLQIAGVHVVHEHGTVERLARVPPKRLKLLGDVADPAFGHPAHRPQRGRMIWVSEQGDLGAIRGPQLEGDREELPQASGRVGLSLQFLDYGLGMPLLPPVQRRLDQSVPVLEVPVEAALGGTELGGDGLHRDGADAAACDRRKRRPGPVVGRERTLTWLAHVRTLPYGQDYTAAYGMGWRGEAKANETPERGAYLATLANPRVHRRLQGRGRVGPAHPGRPR